MLVEKMHSPATCVPEVRHVLFLHSVPGDGGVGELMAYSTDILSLRDSARRPVIATARHEPEAIQKFRLLLDCFVVPPRNDGGEVAGARHSSLLTF
jgi:hypothetical protein